jgi:hypothetical protein
MVDGITDGKNHIDRQKLTFDINQIQLLAAEDSIRIVLTNRTTEPRPRFELSPP